MVKVLGSKPYTMGIIHQFLRNFNVLQMFTLFYGFLGSAITCRIKIAYTLLKIFLCGFRWRVLRELKGRQLVFD
jgi:hypothetical protein